MKSLNVLVYDDETAVAERIAGEIEKACTGKVSAKPKGKKDFRDLLKLLHDRRTKSGSRSRIDESHDVDKADVVVVDFDLRQYSKSATGSRLAYLLRCFSMCGFIVIVNQYGTNTFDLALRSPYNDFVDLHVGDAQIGNPGLWQADFKGYRPWHWPVIPDAKVNFEKCVTDVQENSGERIMEFLGLAHVVDWIPEHARSLLSGRYNIQEITFKNFAESSYLGLDPKDELTLEQSPRVVASRLVAFLNAIILPEQSVLVDAPHMVSRFPSLIKNRRDKIITWNNLCSLADFEVYEMLSKRLKDHQFPKTHWLWRPAWLWPDIFRDVDIPEVKDPWFIEQFDWVFCEDISRFVPEEITKPFNALVSPPFIKRFLLNSDLPDAVEYAPQIGSGEAQDPKMVVYVPEAAMSL